MIFGNGGVDTIHGGGGGIDKIYGGFDNDELWGNYGDDELHGRGVVMRHQTSQVQGWHWAQMAVMRF